MALLASLILFGSIVWVLFAPRRFVLLGMMVPVFYLTYANGIVIAGTSFPPIRLIGIFAFLRVFLKGEFQFSNFNRLDKSFLSIYLFTTIVFLLRSEEDQAIMVARSLDAFVWYFSVRGLLINMEEFRVFLIGFALLIIPFVACLLLERFAGTNPFSVFGAEKQWVREGRIRCFGTFRHPSLLGSVGASFFPLYFFLAMDRAHRSRAILGAVLCLIVVGASNSGGPLSAWLVGAIGCALWFARAHMQTFRRVAALAFIGLIIVMNAPIWYVLARVSAVTGGTGWHRAHLIDQAVEDLGKWWFAGMPITETRDWFPYVLATTGGADITNQYIWFGLQAGILAIFLLILLLFRLYRTIKSALQQVRSADNLPPYYEQMLWGMGTVLFVHLFNWLGISYWDQFAAVWFFHAATFTTIALSCASRVWARESVPFVDDASSEPTLGSSGADPAFFKSAGSSQHSAA